MIGTGLRLDGMLLGILMIEFIREERDEGNVCNRNRMMTCIVLYVLKM